MSINKIDFNAIRKFPKLESFILWTEYTVPHVMDLTPLVLFDNNLRKLELDSNYITQIIFDNFGKYTTDATYSVDDSVVVRETKLRKCHFRSDKIEKDVHISGEDFMLKLFKYNPYLENVWVPFNATSILEKNCHAIGKLIKSESVFIIFGIDREIYRFSVAMCTIHQNSAKPFSCGYD